MANGWNLNVVNAVGWSIEGGVKIWMKRTKRNSIIIEAE